MKASNLFLLVAGLAGCAPTNGVVTTGSAVGPASRFDGLYFGAATAKGGSGCTYGEVVKGKNLVIKGGSGTWFAGGNGGTRDFTIASDGSVAFSASSYSVAGQFAGDAATITTSASMSCNYDFKFSRFVPRTPSRAATSQYDGTYVGVANIDSSQAGRPDCRSQVPDRRAIVAGGSVAWTLTGGKSDIPLGDDGKFGGVAPGDGGISLEGSVAGQKMTARALTGTGCIYIFDLQRT